MNEPAIKTEKITKPIQLLGAWLAGLLSIDSCFLFAAASMPVGSIEARILIVAAILNVPIFLFAVFLLQTKFRPELQEDSYYSTYLSRRTNEPISIPREDTQLAQLNQRLAEIESRMAAVADVQAVEEEDISSLSFGINRHLTDRNELGSKLSALGVIGYSAFGGAEPPTGRTVAISQYLPQKIIRKAVRLAGELGFSHYTIFDNHNEQTEEDVLLGSYGEAQYEIAKAA